ncbi:MAG: hypothetical protein KDG89_12050 [Geminicoccaceae bacterium]|nr:hypothetical protein [Geminicoccaceae bacterium]
MRVGFTGFTAVVALAALGLAGCAAVPPLDPDAPAAVRLPVTLAGAAGVEDGRARFRAHLCAVMARRGEARTCGDVLRRLADEPEDAGPPVDATTPLPPGLRVLFVQGFGAACALPLVRSFADVVADLRRRGVAADLVPVDGFAPIRTNAREIVAAVRALPRSPDERLVLVGHSKGITDILEALTLDGGLAARTAAAVAVAGTVGGSPLALHASDALPDFVAALPGTPCEARGRTGLAELRPGARIAWLARHELPKRVAYYSLVTLPSPERVSRGLWPTYRRLAWFDPRNDGMMPAEDQIIPGGELLGFVNADHLAVAVPVAEAHPFLGALLADRNRFPREAVFEAVLRRVAERLPPPQGPVSHARASASRSRSK